MHMSRITCIKEKVSPERWEAIILFLFAPLEKTCSLYKLFILRQMQVRRLSPHADWLWCSDGFKSLKGGVLPVLFTGHIIREKGI